MAFLIKIKHAISKRFSSVSNRDSGMRPEVKAVFDATWEQDLESMRYLADG